MYKYVRAQALDKDRLKKRLGAMSGTILEHVCKLVLYRDYRPNDINGWVNSIGQRLGWAYKSRCKSSVNADFYIMSVFGEFPVDAMDAESILEEWKEKLVEIGYPYMDDEDVDALAPLLLSVCDGLVNEMLPYLMSKKNNEFNKSFFNNLVCECFKDSGVAL